MDGILWVIGVILFIIAQVIIGWIGEKNVKILIKIIKIEYSIAIPFAIYLWVYESMKLGEFSYRQHISFVLIVLLLFIALIVSIPWLIYKRKVLNRRYPNYILSVREDDSYYSPKYAMLRLLSFSILIILLATIYGGISIIRNYK